MAKKREAERSAAAAPYLCEDCGSAEGAPDVSRGTVVACVLRGGAPTKSDGNGCCGSKLGIATNSVPQTKVMAEWFDKMKDLDEWTMLHGLKPSRKATDKSEKTLAEWAKKQEDEKKNNNLTEEQRCAFDAWNSKASSEAAHSAAAAKEAKWLKKCDAIEAFVAEFGHFPKHH